ncbi:oxidoreductase family protein [Isoptericola sp. CG 20/1183]|uniref:Oxidoreductase family protein n=1 Tax=Isoptericola halotolerans TaxID=300560 RepID=A0ABX5EJ96_9MICO|nr:MULTISPECIES: Gfo/Idh/MocA family oxidoreductase [Isoptericola]PRZ09592.1 oxidoreductase family protein [Isoptericola sp. CG 20/1183]PRZ10393.1 oxidoreductase family protein [Isoptericola halotolerans]
MTSATFAATAGPGPAAGTAAPPDESPTARRRYAVIGTGHRARLYVDAMTDAHADVAELVALCDTNPHRLAFHTDRARAGGAAPARYAAQDVDRMLDDVRPDVVVVTSPDRTHAAHVAAALHHGADVVVEKPLTIDAEGMYTILDAARSSGREVTVAHNYRYAPQNAALRQVVAEGRVGDVVSVHFEWLVDTAHGADYFRRWHRDKSASGGLLVHKASHHFDLVNWWTQDVPESVYVRGGLCFYGEAAGDGGSRYALDLTTDPELRALYHDAAHADGYRRDQDPFGPGATIEDTLSVLVGYRSGASMTYALTAHSPWEGYRVAINGTRGRAELDVVERCHTTAGLPGTRHDDGTPADDGTSPCCAARRAGGRLVVQQHWGRAVEVPLAGSAGHVEGDEAMLRDVLRGHLPPSAGGPADDPLERRAGVRDGLRSVAVGVAGNRSLATGQVVPMASLGISL